MTVDRTMAPVLEKRISPDIADPEKNVRGRWMAEGVELILLKNAIPMGEDSIVYIPWAMVAKEDGRPVFSIQLEKEDLRILSSLTGESLRSLQEDYGTRGFYGALRVNMYGNGCRESLGSYGGSEREEDVVSYLLEAALDILDIVEEAEKCE